MATIKKFNSLEQIKEHLNSETKEALKLTLEQMKIKLKDIIQTNVYDVYEPEFYERTGWILEEGVVDYYLMTMMGNKIYGGIRINDTNYPVNLEKFQHGNVYTGTFYSNVFVEMLNGEVESGIINPFNFPSIIRKPFWDEFLEWADENIETIFKQNCEKLGITLSSKTFTPTPYKGYGKYRYDNLPKHSSSLEQALNTSQYAELDNINAIFDI